MEEKIADVEGDGASLAAAKQQLTEECGKLRGNIEELEGSLKKAEQEKNHKDN